MRGFNCDPDGAPKAAHHLVAFLGFFCGARTNRGASRRTKWPASIGLVGPLGACYRSIDRLESSEQRARDLSAPAIKRIRRPGSARRSFAGSNSPGGPTREGREGGEGGLRMMASRRLRERAFYLNVSFHYTLGRCAASAESSFLITL